MHEPHLDHSHDFQSTAYKSSLIFQELRRHIPFTAISAVLGVLAAFFLNYLYQTLQEPGVSIAVFEVSHPLHIFFSCAASTALLYKYWRRRFGWALPILGGIVVSLVVGNLSDTILPYLGALPLRKETSFHIELFHHPFNVMGAALMGSAFGIVTKRPSTLFHFFHIITSTTASLFYFLGFAVGPAFVILPYLMFVVFVAVIVPCCLSDIVLPVYIANKSEKPEHK